MALKQRKGAAPRVGSMKDLFRLSENKAPGPPDYQRDELIDGRPLRFGEKEKLLSLLRSSQGIDCDEDEVRCAAAYVCAKLGITDILPLLKESLDEGIESPHVRFAFEFAVMYLEIMLEQKTIPERGKQLLILLEMRDSQIPGERRFAEIVLEMAEIKYGTITSW